MLEPVSQVEYHHLKTIQWGFVKMALFPEKGDVKTIPELLIWRVEHTPEMLAYMYRPDGGWVRRTWRDYYEEVKALSRALIGAGLQKGDRVCILGETRPEWVISDLAVIMAGGISVGVYQTLSPEQIEYILNDSGARMIFVENAEQLAKILKIRNNTPALEKIIVWEGTASGEGVCTLEEFIEKEGSHSELDKAFEERWRKVTPDDVAIILYTSGTTGPPKGAMITNHNIVSLLSCWHDQIPLYEDDITVSFLPMAHGAEHVVGFFGRMYGGVGTAYARSIKTVLEDIQDVKPTIFGSVPRIFEKAYSAIQSELKKKPPAVRKLFNWAIGVGKEYAALVRERKPIPLGLKIKNAIADFLVFRKIRRAFGGRVRFFISGAAPISVELLEFFHAVGLLILEVYGLTEATVVTHANTLDEYKFGTVGKPIEVLECKIADDGEVLVRGPTVFKGYWNKPEATKEVIDEEGWLHTGDIGEIDEDGFLRITDRKKHIIVTAGGKNIAPANIENTIKSLDPIISQVHVHGDRRPYITALVTLDEEEAKKFFSTTGKEYPGMADAVKDPELREHIKNLVARANEKLARVEWVRRFVILDHDFTIESGEITPTLKIKRKAIESKYKQLFDDIYEDRCEDVIEVVR